MLKSRIQRCIPICSVLWLITLSTGCQHVTQAHATGGTANLQQFLPNSSLTPGAVRSVTAADVCTADYAHFARNVSIEEKDEVYREYGIMHHAPHQYEVDHLIPLEIGGSNKKRNLWPQPMFTQPWNAHVKDKLENRLHDLVCSGRLSMSQAQQMIATNWITTYQQVFHTELPLSHYPRHRFRSSYGAYPGHESGFASSRMGNAAGGGSTVVAQPPAPLVGNSDKVWVNTNSGKFFTSNQRWYGRTRRGTYMSRESAVQQGFKAAGGD